MTVSSIAFRTALATALLTGAFAATPALAQDAGPVTIENCGRELTFTEAPQRVVSIGQGTTEILLSIGAGERIVGTATWLAPLPESLRAEGEALPRLADNVPSFESVLGTRPDLVLVQWINDIGFDTGRVGTLAQFEEFGVPVYISAAECAKSDFVGASGSGDGARSDAWSVELLEREITELAEIFGLQEGGNALIEDNRARIAEASANVQSLQDAGISVLYWFSSPELEGDAYVAGQLGAPGWISRTIGLNNVIDSNEEWPLVGWETLASLNPTVIVLGTMDRRNMIADDVAEKRRFLETDPLASQMLAVREGYLVEMDAQSMNPTLRAVDGIEVLAQALRDLGLTE